MLAQAQLSAFMNCLKNYVFQSCFLKEKGGHTRDSLAAKSSAGFPERAQSLVQTPTTKNTSFCLAYGPLIQDEPNRILAKDGNQPENLVRHHASVQFSPSLLLMTDNSVSSSMFKFGDTP